MASGAYVSSAVDMWAFGVMFHELATACKPLFFNNKLVIKSDQWAKVDQNLCSIVSSCLVYEAELRPTAAQLLAH